MKNVMGVINVNKKSGDQLGLLAKHRCIASMPFGGKYRLIDFVLSSMANSGIQNVAVFTREKYGSLMNHLGSGKSWDLSRKQDGLIILPPHSLDGYVLPDFELNSYLAHKDFFDRSTQNTVVVAASNIVCNVSFRDAVRFHREKGADITVFYSESLPGMAWPLRHIVELNDEGMVLNIAEGTNQLQSAWVLLEIYILSKSLLMELVEDGAQNRDAGLLTAGIIPNLQNLKIYAYALSRFSAVIDTVDLYYRHSMELLRRQTWEELFFIPGHVQTKFTDEPPARYLEGSAVCGSLLANGCTIAGTVKNSILFEGVKVGRGAQIKSSIIMQKCEIGEGAVLDRVILDKDVCVSAGKVLMGDNSKPLVVEKRRIL